jgi:hypothetical protein
MNEVDPQEIEGPGGAAYRLARAAWRLRYARIFA